MLTTGVTKGFSKDLRKDSIEDISKLSEILGKNNKQIILKKSKSEKVNDIVYDYINKLKNCPSNTLGIINFSDGPIGYGYKNKSQGERNNYKKEIIETLKDCFDKNKIEN